MKTIKSEIAGFILFLLTVGFNVSIGIVIYSLIEEKSELLISLIILGVILLSATLCTIIDHYRRKIMIYEPLNEILAATKQITRGNFNIKLITNHKIKDYDEFDYIKADLNKMASELSKSEILKTDFISNVSHEIKTPLSVILNYASALKNPNLSIEDRQKYLDNMVKSCQKLNNLVTNILKLNKLENQKLIPEFSRFNISDLLINQIMVFESLIERKNITLECDIQEDLFINSEKSYLEIVFSNLLSNAIKFSKQNGKIIINLKKINDGYLVQFIDNGCGMDKATGEHIFEKFYQGDTSHSSEGNGLGLALVKKVITVLGGSINVESELNVGTKFSVVIKE